jgi:hypothetical protein
MTNSTHLEQIKAELAKCSAICAAYRAALGFVIADTARDPHYLDNHLLSYLAQDFIESASAIPLMVGEGIQNVARRELRFVLEAHIKVCFVQQKDFTQPIIDKLHSYQNVFDSPNISVKRDISLSMLSELSRTSLQEEIGRVYGATSKYVHLSRSQIVERIARVDAGRTAGWESTEDIAQFNVLLSRALAASLVLLFHTVPHYVAGDWFVEPSGASVDWYFSKSQFISEIDAAFDYKDERQANLENVKQKRASLIEF